jgi:hypothetical protein
MTTRILLTEEEMRSAKPGFAKALVEHVSLDFNEMFAEESA